MSSVTRFLRQTPAGISLVNAGSILSAVDFIPAPGNYVGNYPPGYVVPADQTGLAAALQAALQSGGVDVVRDMGKTIYCPRAATVGGPVTEAGFYRQFQLLMIKPINLSQGFIGGPNGNTFGVVGPAPSSTSGTSSYVTYYLPTTVAGVGAPGNLFAYPDVQNGNQM